MNATAVMTGLVLIVVGIVCLQQSWRRYNSMNDLVLLDIHRINTEKPQADLDSDPDFVAHREAATGWLVTVSISAFLAFCGIVLIIAGLT